MYRYETHLHTSQASRCGRSTGAEHVRYFHQLGYDGIFVTDHFFGGNCSVPRQLPWQERIRLFCMGYEDARQEGERIGLKVFFAWEETKQGDDYLIYGLSPEWLMSHPEIEGCSRRAQLDMVHAAGGCVVQAHPFRQRDYIPRVLLGYRFADAVEVANAGNHPEEDVCARRYATHFGLMSTCGSDIHLSAEGVPTWGIGLEKPLNCAKDYVRTILEQQPLTVLCPESRFERLPDMPSPEAWYLDEHEEAVPSGIDWLNASYNV